jgi:hypothetical protein
MIPFAESAVETVFESYPDSVRDRILALRNLVFTTAQKMGVIQTLVETLKWGEPSYLTRNGSPLRMNWRAEDPEHYRNFFHCQTKLVPTFRDLYSNDFHFEGNRAIRLAITSDPDLHKLGRCVELTLNYHLVKDLPGLGQKG